MTDQQEMALHLQPSAMIRVWCEYDINGRFGGNNNEEVFQAVFPLTSHLMPMICIYR